jgi:ATP-dependent exoDNAse (exonuclease V) beta subunit
LLLGVKNDLNKETNLLYVALTRTKRRLLLIIDDDDGLKRNFQKRKIDINAAMNELGIQKAVIRDWFAVTDQQIG